MTRTGAHRGLWRSSGRPPVQVPVAELWSTAADAVRALAAADPGLRRFGAAQHRYALAPPMTAAELAALERRLGAELPDELRGFVSDLSAGGAGPGYGIVPLDRAAEHAATAPAGVPWTRGLPLAHLGCGYIALAVLDGSARGEIWVDARAAGVLRPIAADFTALYLDWIDRLAHARWPEPAVPPGSCALAAALSNYLARCEADAGAAPGTLAGASLRGALSRLGPRAIEITTGATPNPTTGASPNPTTGASPNPPTHGTPGAPASAVAAASSWFDDGDRVDPCIACARLLDNLADDGLRRDAVAAGALPRPLRPAP